MPANPRNDDPRAPTSPRDAANAAGGAGLPDATAEVDGNAAAAANAAIKSKTQAPPKPGTKRFKVKSPISLGGKHYQVGEPIDLDETNFAALADQVEPPDARW
jgi:hypothetical protein